MIFCFFNRDLCSNHDELLLLVVFGLTVHTKPSLNKESPLKERKRLVQQETHNTVTQVQRLV